MKINTKHTIPISPSIMVNPNCAILDDEVADIKAHTMIPENEQGRQVNYEPTVIFTPVMTSGRTKRGSPNRPRLDRSEVDEVCTMLSNLFLKEDEKEETKEAEKEETKEDTNEEIKAKERTTQTVQNKLGLFDMSIFSLKTKSSVKVRRSARLATAVKI